MDTMIPPGPGVVVCHGGVFDRVEVSASVPTALRGIRRRPLSREGRRGGEKKAEEAAFLVLRAERGGEAAGGQERRGKPGRGEVR